MMKRFFKFLLVILVCLGMYGCTSNVEPFKIVDISASQLQEKLDNMESFVVIIERDNCPFCEKLAAYVEKTQKEHPGLMLYRIDTTNYGLSMISEEERRLTSNTEDGKILLEMAPYFLYTPSMYVIKDGKPVESGIGYNEVNHSVSLWGLDSEVDFNTAKMEEFWDFLERVENFN